MPLVYRMYTLYSCSHMSTTIIIIFAQNNRKIIDTFFSRNVSFFRANWGMTPFEVSKRSWKINGMLVLLTLNTWITPRAVEQTSQSIIDITFCGLLCGMFHETVFLSLPPPAPFHMQVATSERRDCKRLPRMRRTAKKIKTHLAYYFGLSCLCVTSSLKNNICIFL